MHATRRARGRSGFALIELMIALVVTLIGVLGIFGLLNSSILLNRSTVETSKAAHFAQKRLETVRNTRYEWVASRGSVVDQTLAADDAAADTELARLGLNGQPTWHRAVAEITGYGSGDALKRVVVTVSWGPPGALRSVQLVTYVSRSGLNRTTRGIEPVL